MSEYKGKEREEIEARLKGSNQRQKEKKSEQECGEISQKKLEKDIKEQNFNPEERYAEAIEGLKYRVGIAKEGIKKLATPAGLAGGIIGAISPK